MNHYTAALRGYLTALLGTHRARLAQARARGDAGASAVELAIITAVILAVAVGLLAVIRIFVQDQSSQIHG
jgi:Flp pilus assembly protein TadG